MSELTSTKNYYLLFLIMFFMLLASCDKRKAKKLSGTYECEVDSYEWTMAPSITDTVCYEDLNVVRKGTYVDVMGRLIDVDELRRENTFREELSHGCFSVQFRDDQIFVNYEYNGLGSGVTRNYRGYKK